MLQLIRVILFLIVGTVPFSSSPAQAKDTQEQPTYTIVKKSTFHPGATIVQCKHGHQGVRDKENTLIIPVGFKEIIDCSFGYASRRSDSWDLTNSQGKRLDYFVHSITHTRHGDYIIETEKNKFDILNKDGIKIPLPRLKKIDVLECGYLIRTIHYRWHLITQNGTDIIPYVMKDIERKDDLFIAETENSDVCVFNTVGKVVVPLTDSVEFYNNDTIMVTPTAMYSREKVLIPPTQFYSLRVLKGNNYVQPVLKNGSYNGLSGLYTINGKELFPPQFSSIRYLDQLNAFLVKKHFRGEDTYGIYDSTGKCLLPPIYDEEQELKNVGYQLTNADQTVFITNDSGKLHIQTHRLF